MQELVTHVHPVLLKPRGISRRDRENCCLDGHHATARPAIPRAPPYISVAVVYRMLTRVPCGGGLFLYRRVDPQQPNDDVRLCSRERQGEKRLKTRRWCRCTTTAVLVKETTLLPAPFRAATERPKGPRARGKTSARARPAGASTTHTQKGARRAGRCYVTKGAVPSLPCCRARPA